MNVTVLGAQGLIGAALVRRLTADGHAVRALGRELFTRLDEDWGHVVYAIGLTADFRRRPHETLDAHVTVLSRVLREARFSSLLYLSSTRVYDGAAGTHESVPLAVRPADPSHLYNLSKLLGESLCLTSPQPGLRVARLSNVVGGDDEHSENFVPSLRRDARAGAITLRSAPSTAKDYIALADVLDLLPRIALHGRERLYNVASGRQTTHAEWLERLRRQHAFVLDIVPGAPDLSFTPIEVDRLRAEFGHVPSCAFAAAGL